MLALNLLYTLGFEASRRSVARTAQSAVCWGAILELAPLYIYLFVRVLCAGVTFRMARWMPETRQVVHRARASCKGTSYKNAEHFRCSGFAVLLVRITWLAVWPVATLKPLRRAHRDIRRC